MKKNYLIGIPGCGKSTLGKRLSKVLKIPCYYTDKLLIKEIDPNRPQDLFLMAFNGKFIEIQKRITKKLSKRFGYTIISTGAEVALIPECAEIMKKTGIIIHIKRNPELALADMYAKRMNGLVLTVNGKEVDYLAGQVKEYMEEYSIYESLADFSFDNNGTEYEGLEKLVSLIKNYYSKEFCVKSIDKCIYIV